MGQQSMTVTAPNGKSITITGDRVPTEAELQDIFTKAGVDVKAPAAPPAEHPDPNTVGTFARHIWQQVNPVGVGQILPWPQEWGGGGWDAPAKALRSFTTEQERVRRESVQAFEKGDYLTGVRKGADWLSSVLTLGGSLQLDRASDEMGKGNYAAGLGDTVGLGATLVAPEVAGLVRESAPMQRVADAAEAGARARVVDTMAPKVGPNKMRLGATAERVAPTVVKDIVREGAPASRAGLQELVSRRLAEAEEGLNAAAEARLSARTFETKPLIEALRRKRQALTAEAVNATSLDRGGTVTGQATATAFDLGGAPRTAAPGGGGGPMGRDVVPGPNSARVAMVDQAITELEQLGPVTRYEPIRRIRQSYDGPAKAVYNPSVTQDYMTAQGSKLGAADVTGVLRESLAQMDPGTAAANGTYSVYRAANDVLEATAEVERSRPTVGRTLMAQGLGAAAGAPFGGNAMTVGAIVGPLVERGLNTKVSPAMKLQIARQLGKLADAIRGADPSAIETVLKAFRPLVFSTTNRVPAVQMPAAAEARTEPAR